MPLINGNFYANPAYGQALERGLAQETPGTNRRYNPGDEGSDWAREAQPDPDPAQAPVRQPPAPPQQRQQAPRAPLSENELTAAIHNEAAGLRPASRQGSGSAGDLTDSRAWMGQVAQNNRAGGRPARIAPTSLTRTEQVAVVRNPIARAQYEDARRAAQTAIRAGGNPHGPMHFYLAEEGMPAGNRPAWARGTPVQRFGPFINSAGGGDVRRGARVYVEIHP
jgi:hypothetical protein